MAPLRQKDIDAFFSTARSDPAGSPLQVVALDDSSDGRSDIVAISPPVGVLSPPGASGNAPPAGERGESPSAQLDRLFETSDDGEGGGSDSSRGVQLNSTASRWHNTSRRVIPSDGSDNDGPGSNGPSRESSHTDTPSKHPSRRTKRVRTSSSSPERTPPPRPPPRRKTKNGTTRNGNTKRSQPSPSPSGSEPPASNSDPATPSVNSDLAIAKRTRNSVAKSGASPSAVLESPVDRRLRRMRAQRRGQTVSASPSASAGATDSDDNFVVPDDCVSARVSPAPRSRRKSGKGKRRRVSDPDDETDMEAETEEEDEGVLELDNPERFATTSRLRERHKGKREMALERLSAKRQNKGLPQESDEGSGEDEGTGEDEADEGASGSGTDGDMDGFIEDDDDFDAIQLPAEFSRAANTNEYRFKVMFQFLLILVIHGPDVLPLEGEQKEYFRQPLALLRAHIRNIRDARVRSQIWKDEFIKAMTKYPEVMVSERTRRAYYCHACNRRNQKCWQTAFFYGQPYDPETHEELDPPTELESDWYDEDLDDDTDDHENYPFRNPEEYRRGNRANDVEMDRRRRAFRRLEDDGHFPRIFNMGNSCLSAAMLFLYLTHWEHELFMQIRMWYHQLGPATGRELNDVNAVLDRMEQDGYIKEAFLAFEALEDRASKLGGDDEMRELKDDMFFKMFTGSEAVKR